MDPNKTAPQQPHRPAKPTNHRPLKTVQLPDHERGSRINSDRDFSWTQVWQDFRRPVKQIGTLVIGLLVLGFLTSLSINAVKGLFAPKPLPISTTPTQPATPTSPSPVVNNSPTTVPATATKCGNGKVSGAKIDRAFYAKHPELNGRRLTNSDADKSLREDWCAVANSLSN